VLRRRGQAEPAPAQSPHLGTRGHPPVVKVPGKGSGKVSVAGLACYQPGARARLFYKVRTHHGRKGERRSMSEADYASLLTAAHNQLRAPVIVIWDNSAAQHATARPRALRGQGTTTR
jgi:hypothetical protein